MDLAPPGVLLVPKEKIEKTVNIDKIIFYLRSMYSTHNEEPRTFIDDIPTNEPSFEAMTSRLKTFQNASKMMKILAQKINVYLVDGI